MPIQKAKFSIGDIVKHKHFEFRGVIYDVDFEFNNSEEWYQSIPKNVRPRKDQPFYHLLAGWIWNHWNQDEQKTLKILCFCVRVIEHVWFCMEGVAISYKKKHKARCKNTVIL